MSDMSWFSPGAGLKSRGEISFRILSSASVRLR